MPLKWVKLYLEFFFLNYCDGEERSPLIHLNWFYPEGKIDFSFFFFGSSGFMKNLSPPTVFKTLECRLRHFVAKVPQKVIKIWEPGLPLPDQQVLVLV